MKRYRYRGRHDYSHIGAAGRFFMGARYYRLEEKVGEGGRGVVYRAVDTRLNRNVAVKLLAPHIAGDRSFRERFDRKASEPLHVVTNWQAAGR